MWAYLFPHDYFGNRIDVSQKSAGPSHKAETVAKRTADHRFAFQNNLDTTRTALALHEANQMR